jgi:catechol 2,3-dioxygenase-like lactoylglutathione lyase family enzyme
MPIKNFDHVAIPISEVEAMLEFYRVLGFDVNEKYAPRLYSVHFGDNKINFHGPELWQPKEFTLKGPTAKPGCGDFCFVWDGDSESLQKILGNAGAEIIEGPAPREGGRNGGVDIGTSVYIRDPDLNLLEFIIYP